MSRRQATAYSRMQREVRKAEAIQHEANLGKLRRQEITGPVQDSGTGQTILRMQRDQPPLRTLADAKKIGSVELQAAEEISLAVSAVSARGILGAALLERVNHGKSDQDWPLHIAIAVRNYQRWQMHWSNEWKRTRNPMLSVIWDAVIDARPIAQIAADIDASRHTARRIICAGLRHYAAYAGLITGNQARAWLDEAQGLVFKTLVLTRS